MVSITGTLASSYTPPKEINQFDRLFVPRNVFEGNTCKYILTSTDVALRYKVARVLRTKRASKVLFVGGNI